MASAYPDGDDRAIAEKAAKSRKSKSEHKITAAKVREMYLSGSRAIRAEQYNFWMNHAFLLGDQWLWYNPHTQSIAQLPTDPERVQVKINRLWPASRTIIAKLTSRELTFDVAPTAADDATIKAAKTSEAILLDIAREHKWEELREDASWAAWKGGTAGISVEWDSKAGTPLGLKHEENGTDREFGTGDSVETAMSITDFVVQPGVRDGERGQWWIKAMAYPPSDVQEMFGLEEPPKPDATAGLTPFQNKLLAEHRTGSDQMIDLTMVFTLFMRPNKMHPEGAVCSVVGDKIVDESPWPFPFKDRLNLIIMKETRVGGRWTGETVLTIARPVQTALNQSWSSIIEHMKLAGNARLYVPMSAIEMMDQLSDLPGELVAYPDGTTPPGYASPPQMPNWWIQQPEMLAAELDDILGVHAVSRGESPTNVDSGLGLSILVEQDSTPIGRMVKETAQSFGRLASLVLELYQDKVQETRKAVVATPGQPPQTVDWTGGELHGQTAAVVPTDAIMPRSRAAQQAFAEKAMQMGLVTTLDAFMKLADLPGSKDYLEALSPDVAKARNENAMMAVGNAEIPEDFDEHTVHISEHHTFMKSERWSTMDEAARQIFRDHVQAHATLSAEEMAKQQAKLQVSPALAAAASPTGAPTLLPQDAGAAMPEGMPSAPGSTASPTPSGAEAPPEVQAPGL